MASQEYLNGILEEFQKIRRISEFGEANRSLFGDSLLAQVEEQFHRSSAINVENLISIAFRIEQIAIRLWSDIEYGTQYRQQAKEAFEVAAKLFEQLAEAQVIASRRVHLDLYLHSAIDFSLGEFQANATVLARKVLERFEFGTDLHSRVLRSTFLLLRRTLAELEETLSDLSQTKGLFEQTIQQGIALGELDQDGAIEEAGHFITLEAILSFAQYLRSGQNEGYEVARNKIQSALQMFNIIRDPDNFVLTQLVSLLIRQMHFSSLWHQLGDLHRFRQNPILSRYIQVLTTDKRRPTYELWESQIEALPKVLTDSKAVVLQMPTSAGKTRVAEIKIAHVLATHADSARCIYISPFKSLAAQVEESLDYYLAKVGYRVTSVFGSYESVEFEDFLIEQSDVLVITPEKLDYLFRQQRDFFDTVKLIVVDEGHLLDNGVRGLRLEILLHRLQKLLSDKGLQILFISAVVPNSEEIATWLAQGEPVLVGSKWKPTKLRQGVFYWGSDWKGRIRYREEQLELITDIEKRLIQEFHKTQPGVRLKHPKYYPDTIYEIAIELALNFLKASPTIIFTAVREHVDSIARNLYNRIQEMREVNPTFRLASDSSKEELERLAQKVERRLGEGFPLSTYIREGFAYHHGHLPDDLRSAIEEAFRKESLAILIATPTLAQGVNLPVHLMIVANLERGSAMPFLIRDFRNIAGRAGRALHETEGYVIFVQNTQSDWLVDQMYRRYLRDDRIEPVQSVLFNLYTQLIERKLGISLSQFLTNPVSMTFTDKDLQVDNELDTAFQTQVLALLYEEVIRETDPDTVRNTIDQTLFGTQWKHDRTYYEPLVEYSKQHVRYLTTQFQSQGQKKAFYKTGFAFQSCQALEAEIRELAREGVFPSLRNPTTGSLDEDILARILRLVSIPKETAGKYKGNVDLAHVMIRWINFADLNQLVAEYKDKDSIFEDPLKVSDIIYHQFMNNAPWALNSIVKILTYLRDEELLPFDHEIGLLPAYVKYGVNTPAAAYISGMGVSDREIARIMADYYYQDTGLSVSSPDLNNFREWVQDLTFEGLLTILHDKQHVHDVWAALRRYKLDARPVDYFTQPRSLEFKTFVVGLQYEDRLNHVAKINEGDALRLIREPDNPFDSYALAVYTAFDQKLGYIRSSKAFTLSTLLDEGQQFSCVAEKIYPATNHPNRRLLVRINGLVN